MAELVQLPRIVTGIMGFCSDGTSQVLKQTWMYFTGNHRCFAKEVSTFGPGESGPIFVELYFLASLGRAGLYATSYIF